MSEPEEDDFYEDNKFKEGGFLPSPGVFDYGLGGYKEPYSKDDPMPSQDVSAGDDTDIIPIPESKDMAKRRELYRGVPPAVLKMMSQFFMGAGDVTFKFDKAVVILPPWGFIIEETLFLRLILMEYTLLDVLNMNDVELFTLIHPIKLELIGLYDTCYTIMKKDCNQKGKNLNESCYRFGALIMAICNRIRVGETCKILKECNNG